jgi:hypothetical protein
MKCRDNEKPGVPFVKETVGFFSPHRVITHKENQRVGSNRPVSVSKKTGRTVCGKPSQKYEDNWQGNQRDS